MFKFTARSPPGNISQTSTNAEPFHMSAYTMNPEQRTPGSRLVLLHHLRLQWWFWELLGATVSIFAFGAIVIILKVYDGQASPQFPADITLNALISLLGTFSKSTLLLVVSTAISQFKWIWFKNRSRKLRDLQIFDEASRGPWGAMAMLRHSRKSMGSLGALIVLLLIAFDPLVQQVIATPQRVLSFEAESTTLHKALKFDMSAAIDSYTSVQNAVGRLNGANPVRTLASTIADGASSLGRIEDFSPVCPTANCTWPTFQSLGLCSTCKNVTEYARQNWECRQNGSETITNDTPNRVCTYNLPYSAFNYSYLVLVNGAYHETDEEMRQKIWTTELNQTDFSQNIFLIVSRIVMEETDILLPGPAREQVREATECAIAMCITEHDLSVREGITNDTIISTSQPFGSEAIPGIRMSTQNDIVQVEENGVTYQVDLRSSLSQMAESIQDTMEAEIRADYINDTTRTSKYLDGDLSSYDSIGNQAYTSLAMTYYAGFPFEAGVENMVVSVSQYLRSLSNDTIVGQAHSLETYVKVRWVWLVFPAVLITSGLGLLLYAILKTEQSGVEVWKSSSLPLFFCTEGETRSGFAPQMPLNTVVDMDSEATEIRVRLGREASSRDRWRLQTAEKNEKSSSDWEDSGLAYSSDIIGTAV